MKQYPPVLSRIFQLCSVIVWLVTNAVLFVCLVWYPMTVGWYGLSFPGLVEPVLDHMSRLVGWPLLVTSTLIMLILEYSIAAAEGCLVGLAWAARHRWRRDWRWWALLAGILLGLHLAVDHPVFFGLFSLAGLVALCGQGLRWRQVLLVLAALLFIGALAFFVGACGQVAVIANTAPVSPLTLTDWLIGILLVLVLPLLLLGSCAVLSARCLYGALQGAFPENGREKQR